MSQTCTASELQLCLLVAIDDCTCIDCIDFMCACVPHFRDNGVTSSVITREFMVEQAPIEEVVSTSMHVQEVEDSSDEGEEEDDGWVEGVVGQVCSY